MTLSTAAVPREFSPPLSPMPSLYSRYHCSRQLHPIRHQEWTETESICCVSAWCLLFGQTHNRRSGSIHRSVKVEDFNSRATCSRSVSKLSSCVGPFKTIVPIRYKGIVLMSFGIWTKLSYGLNATIFVI